MENKFKVRCIHTTDANFTVEKVTEPYEFKVGDRVETEFGKGTVKFISLDMTYLPYAVELDTYKGGNYCNAHTTHGRWFEAYEMTLLQKESPTKHNEKIIITHDGTTTTAKLYDNKNIISTAESVCAPTDTFDFATGANLALDQLYKSSEVREVKRPAKVGEWIKIVDAREAEGCYSNGDVLCVEEENHICGIYAKTVNTHPCCKGLRKGMSYIGNNEYVVLENYTPPAEPTKHEYKAGDLAKIVAKTCAHNQSIGDVVALLKKRTSSAFVGETCWQINDKNYVRESDIEPFDGRIIQ